MENKFYQQSISDTLKNFSTNLTEGLTSEEVISRHEKYGYNEFEKVKHTSLLQKFISQF